MKRLIFLVVVVLLLLPVIAACSSDEGVSEESFDQLADESTRLQSELSSVQSQMAFSQGRHEKAAAYATILKYYLVDANKAGGATEADTTAMKAAAARAGDADLAGLMAAQGVAAKAGDTATVAKVTGDIVSSCLARIISYAQ